MFALVITVLVIAAVKADRSLRPVASPNISVKITGVTAILLLLSMTETEKRLLLRQIHTI